MILRFVVERINKTLSVMGPPVFYGGFSTLLAFILLAGSTSYVFSTFFKVGVVYNHNILKSFGDIQRRIQDFPEGR